MLKLIVCLFSLQRWYACIEQSRQQMITVVLKVFCHWYTCVTWVQVALINNPFIPNIIIRDSIVLCLCWCLYLLLLLFYNCIGYFEQTKNRHGQWVKHEMLVQTEIDFVIVLMASGFQVLDFRVLIAFWIKCENINHCISQWITSYFTSSVKSVKTMSVVKVI